MAGKGILEADAATFDQTIGSGVVLVDCWAPWCGPCFMQGRILKDVAAQITDPNVKIVKLNVDEAPQIAARYGIRAIPTLLLFKDGQMLRQFVGVQSAPTLMGAVEQAASDG